MKKIAIIIYNFAHDDHFFVNSTRMFSFT